MYTKEYLQTLYDKEKETIKKNRISKIVDFMITLVTQNAKKGELSCKENFPNEINEIKEEIMGNLKLIFPDSKINIDENEYLNHHPRSVYISINWE